MQLLRAVSAIGGNDHRMIGELAKWPSVTRAECEDWYAANSGRFGRAQHVRRRSTGRMDDQEIAWVCQRLDLSRENMLEAEVVPGGGEERCVRREGNGRIRAPSAHVADDVFRRHVLRVGGAATVPTEEEGSTRAHGILDESERDVELRTECLRHARRQLREIAKGVSELSSWCRHQRRSRNEFTSWCSGATLVRFTAGRQVVVPSVGQTCRAGARAAPSARVARRREDARRFVA